jgi:hypothetical protein
MKNCNIHKFGTSTIVAAAVALAAHSQGAVQYNVAYDNAKVTVNGAIYQEVSPQPTGTGVIDPFLTIQDNGMEQGYNSSTGNFDTKREPQWNHEITFSQLQQTTTTLNGTQYFQFLLDINEANGGGKQLLSLDAVRIYTSASIQTNTSTDSKGNFNGSLGTLRYNLDGAGDAYLKMDYSLNSGSGSGDLFIFVPVANFAGAKSSDYVYLYAQFGLQKGMGCDMNADAGFEEFALVNNVAPIPEVPAFLPLGGVLILALSVNFLRHKRASKTVG